MATGGRSRRASRSTRRGPSPSRSPPPGPRSTPADRDAAGRPVLRVEVVGPHALLPLAHAVAREAATDGGWVLAGTVRETYLALGPSLRTTVDVPIAAAARTS